MGRKKIDRNFTESLVMNRWTYDHYLNKLTEIAQVAFTWEDLPTTCDQRYLERSLFYGGQGLFFKDEVMGFLTLDFAPMDSFNVYGYPIGRRAYSKYNQYTYECDINNSVIIYNNYNKIPTSQDVVMYAKRLYLCDRVMDVNINAQKTPMIIQCSEKQRLTMENLYMKYDGNQPFIFADKSLDLNDVKVLKTDAPFVSDKVYDIKSKILNEAYIDFGIASVFSQKKERLVKDEAQQSIMGAIANRYIRLKSRKEAVEKINEMFNLNVSVRYTFDSANEEVSDFLALGDGEFRESLNMEVDENE